MFISANLIPCVCERRGQLVCRRTMCVRLFHKSICSMVTLSFFSASLWDGISILVLSGRLWKTRAVWVTHTSPGLLTSHLSLEPYSAKFNTRLEYNIRHTGTRRNSYINFTAKFLICIHFKDSISYVNATDKDVAVWIYLPDWTSGREYK